MVVISDDVVHQMEDTIRKDQAGYIIQLIQMNLLKVILLIPLMSSHIRKERLKALMITKSLVKIRTE